jgi:hypothetical protein
LCAAIEWIKPLFLEGGRFLNQEGKQVALLGQVYSGEQLDYFPAMMGGTEIVVINDLDWQVQLSSQRIIALASTILSLQSSHKRRATHCVSVRDSCCR